MEKKNYFSIWTENGSNNSFLIATILPACIGFLPTKLNFNISTCFFSKDPKIAFYANLHKNQTLYSSKRNEANRR